MAIKRIGRSNLSRNTISYGIDYGCKHKREQDMQKFKKQNRALLYARDFRLRMDDARAITVEADNCDPYDPESDFAQTRRFWGKNQQKNQAGNYVLAANEKTWDELKKFLANRDHKLVVNEIDLYREWGKMALEVGELIAGDGDIEKGKNDYQIAVQTHADENGMHAHFEINTVNLNTGKKMNYDHDDLLKIYDYADKVYRDRGLTIQGAGLERVKDQETGKYITQKKGGRADNDVGYQVKSMLKNGHYSYVDDLNMQFELVLSDSKVKSKQDAINELRKRKIQVDQRDDQHKFIKAHWQSLKYDVKSHGKTTQKQGEGSKSIRIRSFTCQEADHQLSLEAHNRTLIHELLQKRANTYSINRLKTKNKQGFTDPNSQVDMVKIALKASKKTSTQASGDQPKSISRSSISVNKAAIERAKEKQRKLKQKQAETDSYLKKLFNETIAKNNEDKAKSLREFQYWHQDGLDR